MSQLSSRARVELAKTGICGLSSPIRAIAV